MIQKIKLTAETESTIHLSTVHSAKGLEGCFSFFKLDLKNTKASRVFIISRHPQMMVEHEWKTDIEQMTPEEKCLWYVAGKNKFLLFFFPVSEFSIQ